MRSKQPQMQARRWWKPVLAGLLLLPWSPAQAAGRQQLHGHRPKALSSAAVGPVDEGAPLNLSIGLPLRNADKLQALLADLYDPSSPRYHQFLNPQAFAEQFGPSAADYQAVEAFAKAQGLEIRHRHGNRMVLDVRGKVADIQRGLHVKLGRYRRADGSEFRAPDAEPSVDLDTPILHISGLNNAVRPKPLLRKADTAARKATAEPMGGSGPLGGFLAHDLRAAYAANVNLSGTGQSVALLEFNSGFHQSDITAYEALCGLPNVPVQTVLLDGYDGSEGQANDEVSLDIEMAMSMAPGLSKIVVYEGDLPDSILNRIATDNSAKQISSSWGFTSDPTCEQILLQYAAQGQSFFQASGDSGTWPANWDYPFMANPYMTVVGGTTLFTRGGSYYSETTWNWQNGWATGGGISSVYGLPSYQLGLATVANQASSSMRNIPDVALTADNVWVVYANGNGGNFGGTSAATPLWAAYMALVNQQGASLGKAPIGFANPALYSLAKGPKYGDDFHDIADNSGNGGNTAVTGYDLCTGWGSPNGWGVINDLTGVSATPTPSPTPTRTNTPQTGCRFNSGQAASYPVGQADLYMGAPNRGLPTAAANSLFGPRCMVTDGTRFVVADTRNNRVLVYNHLPSGPSAQADVVIGQPDMASTQVNQGASVPNARTLNYPVGLAWNGSQLFVADTSNCRVLVFNGIPTVNNTAASMVVGQPDYSGYTAAFPPTANSLSFPMNVLCYNGKLLVADSQNSRVMIYNHVPTANGAAADTEIGQTDFSGISWSIATPTGLWGPHSLAVVGGKLLVADGQGNNTGARLLVYNSIPTVNGAAYDLCLTPANQSPECAPSTLGVTINDIASDGTRLYVATDHNVSVFNHIPTAAGSSYDVSLGEPDAWTCGAPVAPSPANLYGPAGVMVFNGLLYVADTMQNRLLVYQCQNSNPTATPTPGRQAVAPSCTLRTAAGHGVAGYAGDGGPATAAAMTQCWGLGADSVGNFYIADAYNSRVRKVDPAGNISTVAGNGTYGISGDGSWATMASLRQPWTVKVTARGTLLILDQAANNVREVTPWGEIITIVGDWAGNAGYSDGGGHASTALLRQPSGLALDTRGNLYVVDAGNFVIRKVTPSGLISNIAGVPGQAGFSGDGGPATAAKINPSGSTLAGMAVDASGNVYFCDTNNYRIRRIGPDGVISTVAGTGTPGNSGDGGPATAATFTNLQGLALDGCQFLYVSDANAQRIRRIGLANGVVTAVAGTGAGGFSGDGGAASSGAFNNPEDLAFLANGDLLVMDRSNIRVRAVAACNGGCPVQPLGLQARGLEARNRVEAGKTPGMGDLPVGPSKPVVVAPNPGKDHLNLAYYLSVPAKAGLAIYNIQGGKVADLELGERPAGAGEVGFDASHLASGIYFAVLVTDNGGGATAQGKFKFTLVK